MRETGLIMSSSFSRQFATRMLFKVEVTDANLYRNWRGYTVKNLSDDEDIINRFTMLHGIHLGSDGDDANYNHFVCHLGDDTALDAPEGGDSSNNEEVVLSDTVKTPTSKPYQKKPSIVDGVGAYATKGPPPSIGELPTANSTQSSPIKHAGKRSANIDGCEVATAKETKMVCVKIEDPK
ncbi:replication factor A protein [Trifolium medium]|uniref:Replication factor A protein n=1 Tax=Trifolium medium TaxID=97028 RepID=A0A392PBY8_9FABA|nr:replication factor A protein [Trifolium medium]